MILRGLALLLLLAQGVAGAQVVRVGLETLEADAGAPLAGKRLGLVVHAASVTADGRHAVDVARGLGLDVVRLFSPEHGLTGQAAAGRARRLRLGGRVAAAAPRPAPGSGGGAAVGGGGHGARHGLPRPARRRADPLRHGDRRHALRGAGAVDRRGGGP